MLESTARRTTCARPWSATPSFSPFRKQGMARYETQSERALPRITLRVEARSNSAPEANPLAGRGSIRLRPTIRERSQGRLSLRRLNDDVHTEEGPFECRHRQKVRSSITRQKKNPAVARRVSHPRYRLLGIRRSASRGSRRRRRSCREEHYSERPCRWCSRHCDTRLRR